MLWTQPSAVKSVITQKLKQQQPSLGGTSNTRGRLVRSCFRTCGASEPLNHTYLWRKNSSLVAETLFWRLNWFFSSHSSEAIEINRELDAQVDEILDPTFVPLLHKWYGSYVTGWSEGQWNGSAIVKRRSQAFSRQSFYRHNSDFVRFTLLNEPTLQFVIHKLQQYLESEGVDEAVSIYEKAFYEQKVGSFKRKRYAQHSLHFGDFFEALVSPPASTQSGIQTPCTNGLGTYSVYQIQALLGCTDNRIWAVALLGTSTGTERTYTFSSPPVQARRLKIVELTTSVRKCFAVHSCHLHSTCKVDVHRRKVYHDARNNNTFTVLGRRNGFPPRRSWYLINLTSFILKIRGRA